MYFHFDCIFDCMQRLRHYFHFDCKFDCIQSLSYSLPIIKNKVRHLQLSWEEAGSRKKLDLVEEQEMEEGRGGSNQNDCESKYGVEKGLEREMGMTREFY